ncbi:MAG: hypothetical protein ACQESG_04600 [Nanobdellota archaeon]
MNWCVETSTAVSGLEHVVATPHYLYMLYTGNYECGVGGSFGDCRMIYCSIPEETIYERVGDSLYIVEPGTVVHRLTADTLVTKDLGYAAREWDILGIATDSENLYLEVDDGHNRTINVYDERLYMINCFNSPEGSMLSGKEYCFLEESDAEIGRYKHGIRMGGMSFGNINACTSEIRDFLDRVSATCNLPKIRMDSGINSYFSSGNEVMALLTNGEIWKGTEEGGMGIMKVRSPGSKPARYSQCGDYTFVTYQDTSLFFREGAFQSSISATDTNQVIDMTGTSDSLYVLFEQELRHYRLD